MLKKIKELIKSKDIEDIYLVGFVDIQEEMVQFYHNLRFIYFEINSKYIKLESINQFSKMKIRVVESIESDFEIDEDMTMAKSSISEIILNDTMAYGNNINKIVFYNLQDSSELICDAIEIELANKQNIFFDPSYYFGINVGGREQKQLWKNNFTGNIRTTCVNIGDD